jgi:predicted ArsR family transcriptional regulator
MSETTGFSEPVARSIDLLVDSLIGLEALLALYRETDRIWTAADLARQLRISMRAARHELERLRARGVAEADSDGNELVFRYRPVDSIHADHVARIAEAYATRRIETINHVASSRLRRVRAATQ